MKSKMVGIINEQISLMNFFLRDSIRYTLKKFFGLICFDVVVRNVVKFSSSAVADPEFPKRGEGVCESHLQL